MKYMSFPASCSYAGLANMLEIHGVDTEDHLIAKSMGLPFLFSREGETFLSGPMLQTADWFRLFLLPLGYELIETAMPRHEVPVYLRAQTCAMLGLRLSAHGKHAVVFTGCEYGTFRFINNKHRDAPGDDQLILSTDALIEMLDDTVVVAVLRKCEPRSVNLAPHFHASLQTLEQMLDTLDQYLSVEHDPMEVRQQLNVLFRPIFLDGISMMDLAGEHEIAESMLHLQSSLLHFLKMQGPAVPYETISRELLHSVFERLRRLIQAQVRACSS